MGFPRLLHGDLHFGKEVLLALRGNGFLDVRPDGRA